MQHYTLIFATSDGNRRSFRVKNPIPGLPQDEILSAVDMLTQHPIMAADRGQLTRLNRMDLHVTSVTPVI
jgi:hypothetical protein